jgi:hypothetical protein
LGDSEGYGRGGQYSALQEEVVLGPVTPSIKKDWGRARSDGVLLGLAGETLKTWIGIYQKREGRPSILTSAW